MMIEKLKIKICKSLPRHWVIIGESEAWIVPAKSRGWQERKRFKGYISSLESCPGYNFVDLDVPLRRQWSEVCKDLTGEN